ncbi:hypothetical protein LUZ60_008092 [Juncus effusus]|nr:hypothetical protein LUZ60_008092 [Juncus effusus]
MSPLFPILSLLLLPHLFIPCKSSPICLSASQCGDITIKYPFSLYTPQIQNQNETQISSPYCGYPGLLISCENKTPILYLQSNNNNYTISSIDYDTTTITLASTNIMNSSDSSCPKTRQHLSAYYSPDYSVNLVFLVNSSSSSLPANYTATTCLAGNNYVITTSDVSDWSQICKEIVTAPVLGNNSNSYNLSAELDLGLNQGFQLGWSKKWGNCSQCEERGWNCGYNLTSESTFVETCLCAGPKCSTSTGTGIGVGIGIGGKKRKLKDIIIGISAGVSGFITFCIAAFLLFQRRNSKAVATRTEERNKAQKIEVALESYASFNPKRYEFSEIRKMTKSFSEKLGQGGYGSVFKGKLNDGSLVAVKVFKDRESNGEEFLNEVASIARTSHVNIVRLLGFSLKRSKRALIYEFMPNGSLDKYLSESRNSTMTHAEFERLFEIAVGIARGLEYLHRGCNTQIVHFDIKPHNILLDQDYCPKISDFGLAKFCRPKESNISMSGMRGTIGYIAPEVFSRNFGTISSKSDVYSYGMMVFEMLGEKQKKPSEIVERSSESYFPDNIYKYLEENIISSIYGLSEANEEIVRKMAIVGLWCIQVLPDARPTMSRVLDMLEGSVEDLNIPQKLHISLHPELVVDSSSAELP